MVAVTDVLVSTGWLAEHLLDEGLRLVDCRFSFDHDATQDYLRGHIPEAVHVELREALTSQEGPVRWAIPDPEPFTAAMSGLGIGDGTTVVAYDGEGGHYASRLWLCLMFYGHAGIHILNGGLTKWLAEGRPLTADVPQPAAARFTPRPAAPELRVTAEQVRAAIGRPGTMILDVRRASEFSGDEVRAARGGRIPSSVHALWQENLNWDSDRTFKEPAVIAERYRRLGLRPETEAITYCQGGVRAAHSALCLLLAGHEKVSVYDGSWDDWGNREDLPIERG